MDNTLPPVISNEPLQVIPNTSIPNTPQVVAPEKSNKNKFLIAGLVVSLLVLVFVGVYFWILKPGLGKVESDSTKVVKKEITFPKYWVNCEDSRQIIAEGDRLYIACNGGVLVMDTSGNVVDQITMPDGLGDSTATSIIKTGDLLYIGSQDGLTKFDLKSRVAKKISVNEGLVNGSNIKLALDGTFIWVATFNGVSRLNINDDSLTNYTTELDSVSEKRNIGDILVVSKYVYFLELASAYSSGAVIQFNKTTNTFKTFKPADFGRVDQYARLDFNSIAKYGNVILVSDNKEIFSLDESTDSAWKKVDSAVAYINKDQDVAASILYMLKNQSDSGVLMTSANKIYSYNPQTDETNVFYDFGNTDTGKSIKYTSELDTLWFSYYDQNQTLIYSFNINSKEIKRFSLNRPKAFGSVVGVVDDDIFVNTVSGLYKYTLESDKFVPVYSSTSFGGNLNLPGFWPIPNTQEIFMYQQFCGQSCEKPIVNRYNYLENTIKEVVIPQEVLELGSTEMAGMKSYAAFNLDWADFASNKIGFSYNDNGVAKYISYNTLNGEWIVESGVPENAQKLSNYLSTCNHNFSFKNNNNSFVEYQCTQNAVDGNTSWSIVEGKVVEKDVPTGESRTLTLPNIQPHYTPFETVANMSLKQLMFVDGLLWISTDRGLITYNRTNQTYKVYGPKEGLLSADIENFIVTDKYIWVVTNWGGLSVIKK